MRLSELQQSDAPKADEWKLPHPRSELADPPITAEEARSAEHWICPYHNGLIASTHTEDEYGRAFYCPVGGMYWRFTKQQSGMYAPLDYPPSDIV